MKNFLYPILLLAAVLPPRALAEALPDPMERPPIKAFLAAGFGERHPMAPPQTEQFGRLVGLWKVETELARQGDGWVESKPGFWAWKYTLGGFAVADLWYQGADDLPDYLANFGRDYLLTANRIYSVADGEWRVAWMANGAGSGMGVDVGSFTAELVDEDVVMMSVGGMGLQRVVFSGVSEKAFDWRSEYSMDDGKSWTTAMRMHATRVSH